MTTNGTVNNVKHCGTACRIVQCWKWDVSEIINARSRRYLKYAVLILNRPITQNNELIKELWNNASIRMTVDGGTVKWDEFLDKLSQNEQKTMKVPDLITGDFDSITKDVLQKFKNTSCKIVHTPDQNLTDFTKALMELQKHTLENSIELDNVFAISQSSGRIDHILANIQTMFLARDQNLLSTSTYLFLISDDSISWLLRPGDHIIIVPENVRKNKKVWCSLIPVGETCHNIITDGLKWNLNNQSLKFGELVSTSNTFDGSEKVKIKCSNTVLWSMRIPCVGDQ